MIRERLKDSLASYSDDIKCSVYNHVCDGFKRIVFRYDSRYVSLFYKILEGKHDLCLCHGDFLLAFPNLYSLFCFVFFVNFGELRLYIFFSLSFRICNISSLDCKCISKNIAVCDPWVYGFMSSGKEHNQSTDCKTSSIDFTALCSTYHAYFKNNYFSSRDHDKTSLYTY